MAAERAASRELQRRSRPVLIDTLYDVSRGLIARADRHRGVIVVVHVAVENAGADFSIVRFGRQGPIICQATAAVEVYKSHPVRLDVRPGVGLQRIGQKRPGQRLVTLQTVVSVGEAERQVVAALAVAHLAEALADPRRILLTPAVFIEEIAGEKIV